MRLLLEVAPEAVSAQHLQRAEQHEVPQRRQELGARDGHIGFQRIEIRVDEFRLELLGVGRLGLPDERGHVVVDRALPAALEVDEIRLAVLDHHVPRLEVAVEERVGHAAHQHVGHLVEVLVEFDLAELQARGLEEAVFEIVLVEGDHPPVELRLREAHREVEALRALELEPRQGAHRLDDQHPLGRGVGALLAALAHQAEQRVVAQVFLQVAGEVAAVRLHLRHVQALRLEMLGHRPERLVLLDRSSLRPDQRLRSPANPEISSVTPRRRQFLESPHRLSGIFFKKSFDRIHIFATSS